MAPRIEANRGVSFDLLISDEDWIKFKEAGRGFIDDSQRDGVAELIEKFYRDYCFAVFSIPPEEARHSLEMMLNRAGDLFLSIQGFDLFLKLEEIYEKPDSDRIAERFRNASSKKDRHLLSLEFDEHILKLVQSGKILPNDVPVIRMIECAAQETYFPDEVAYINKILSDVAKFMEIIECAVKQINIGPGSCGDKRTTKFLQDLHVIFSDASGNAKITKEFLGFAEEICQRVKDQSLEDFGQQIKTPVMYLHKGSIEKRLRDAASNTGIQN